MRLRTVRAAQPQTSFSALCFLLAAVLLAPFASAQTPALAGIAHAAFRVSDLEKSRAFYEKLGYQQFLQFTSSDGKPSVSYMKVNDRQFIELYPQRDSSQPLGLMHVCYESDDLNKVHDAYVARGLTPTEVKKAHAGNLLFVLHDPEQQTIEYTQYEPGSLHSEDRGKHLGASRVSQQLLGAKVPVQDLNTMMDYYTGKLGFVKSSDHLLRVPGNSGQFIQLAAGNQKPGITLQVSDVKQAARQLRQRGIEVQVRNGKAEIRDPDGAEIVFEKAAGK